MANEVKPRSTAELLNSRCYYSAMLEYQALNETAHVEVCKEELRKITEQAAKNKEASQKFRESREARRIRKEKTKKLLRKGMIVLAGLAIAALLFFAFTQWIPNAIVKNRALEYYAAGAYDQALVEAEKHSAGDAKDSLVAEIRRAKAIGLAAEGKYTEAMAILSDSADYEDWVLIEEYNPIVCYQDGSEFMSKGMYEEAIQAFENANGYKDSSEMIQKAFYQIGIDFVSQGKYAEAIQAFENADGYSDSAEQIKEAKYLQAKVLMADGNYDGACKYLAAIPGYKDVYSIIMGNERIKELYFSVGNYVTFGTYPQASEGTDSTPIEWLVLSKQDNKVLLISRYGLDAKPYNTTETAVTWENCTLRTWLNSTFINKAFTSAEQTGILTTTVDNSGSQCYPKWSTSGGNNTQDKIFLLSYAEANTYFKSDDARRCAPTDYAIKQGAWTSETRKVDGRATGWWWLRSPGPLRSPGSSLSNTANVMSSGALGDYDYSVNDGDVVRPALWIDIGKLIDCFHSYESGSKLLAEGKYEEAIQAFENAYGYNDSAEQIKEAKYLQAKAFMEVGQYDSAHDLFATIRGYKDVDSIITSNERIKELDYFTVGNYVTFGTYPQTSEGTDSTPIEWLVLDVQGNRALVISRYGLDAKPYNTKYVDVTWETCTLRTWLNGEFLNTAFSSAEQDAILTTAVDNSKSQCNSKWNTTGGNNTQDKVFLLSYAEAEKYFESNDARMCAPTDYAKKQGAYTSSSDKVDGRAAGWWWLRSPGTSQYYAAYVFADGSLSHTNVGSDGGVVRPALWLNLESGIF